MILFSAWPPPPQHLYWPNPATLDAGFVSWLTSSALFTIKGYSLTLAVATSPCFSNTVERAPLVAVGGYLEARSAKHEAQASQATGSNFSAGLYEWELMIRSEAAEGNLHPALLGEAKRQLRALYARFAGALPEIARLMTNLDELTSSEPSGLLRSERFQADFAYARANVAQRIADRKRRAAESSAVSLQPTAAT